VSPSLQILLFIAVIILGAKLSGAAAVRVGLPLVLGELLAGVLLGPTVLNIGALQCFAPAPGLGAVSVEAVFKVLAEIGVVLLMFVAGLETDIAMMRMAVAPALSAASGGVILPLVGGCLLARSFGFGWQEAIFMGTILTATSVTITAQTLMNLNQIRSKPGSTILGAAVIDDVLGLIVLSLVIALGSPLAHSGGAGRTGLLLTLARMVGCLIILFWLGPPLTRWVLSQSSRLHIPHPEVAAAVIIAFLFAFQAEWLGGMAAITGSYLAGLFVAATPAHESVSNDLRSMATSFFGPLFFVSVGLAVNARQLGGHPGFLVLLLGVAVLGKVLGCGLGARLHGFCARDSLIVGVGMIPRGEVGLITASLGWAAGVVSQTVYVEVVVLVLATTLITPALLRFAFPGEPMEAGIGSTGAVEINSLDGLSGVVADVADA
jgi:Kef-type K+ transport system membrane component KefB